MRWGGLQHECISQSNAQQQQNRHRKDVFHISTPPPPPARRSTLYSLGLCKSIAGPDIKSVFWFLLLVSSLLLLYISEINSCIKYLESAVALKVKVTTEKANLKIGDIDTSLPKSLSKLIAISESCKKNQKNIIEIEI